MELTTFIIGCIIAIAIGIEGASLCIHRMSTYNKIKIYLKAKDNIYNLIKKHKNWKIKNIGWFNMCALENKEYYLKIKVENNNFESVYNWTNKPIVVNKEGNIIEKEDLIEQIKCLEENELWEKKQK